VFTPAGRQPSPSAEEYHVRVLVDGEEDASGNDRLGYPSCLSPADASPISHRLLLDILHRETRRGGR
jgi:hypothetical protein